ncbi:phorbol-12-myristate-13-acetate-induced protein 1 isoform 3 [Homo sapiens]|uniref:phorbol-12-myristate-13-acetate-induced protein 1 isoform 3 n=1 Tax=Homo sapiens TaxID=9606 RepID=UPI00148A28EE|nr:phorbol-12-myristate-13-acetate-induced protein 1 isoform 3 [Homo sapiens]
MPGKKARKNAQPSPARAPAGTDPLGPAKTQAGRGRGRGRGLGWGGLSSPGLKHRLHGGQGRARAGSRVCYSTQEIWRQTELPAETSESDIQTLLLRNLTASKTCMRGLLQKSFLRRCTFHQFEERLHCN